MDFQCFRSFILFPTIMAFKFLLITVDNHVPFERDFRTQLKAAVRTHEHCVFMNIFVILKIGISMSFLLLSTLLLHCIVTHCSPSVLAHSWISSDKGHTEMGTRWNVRICVPSVRRSWQNPCHIPHKYISNLWCGPCVRGPAYWQIDWIVCRRIDMGGRVSNRQANG